MCFKNNKFILLRECLLKYWDMIGNLFLYISLQNELFDKNRYPIWIYVTGFCAIITSFARLMLKFRRLDIQSIKYLTNPMLPCERYMCNTRENGTYSPSCNRLFCGGFILFFLWLFYAILIYPFITFFVIISVFYKQNNDEINLLLLLYKNHNIQSILFEDIPLLVILIQIYIIEQKKLIIIWVSLSTFIKITLILKRIYHNKILYDIEELNENIIYNLARSKSSEKALNLELQIIKE